MQRLDLICFDSYLLSKSLTHHWFSSNHSVTSQNVFTVSGICKIDAAYCKSSQMFTTQHVLQKKKKQADPEKLIHSVHWHMCTWLCEPTGYMFLKVITTSEIIFSLREYMVNNSNKRGLCWLFEGTLLSVRSKTCSLLLLCSLLHSVAKL